MSTFADHEFKLITAWPCLLRLYLSLYFKLWNTRLGKTASEWCSTYTNIKLYLESCLIQFAHRYFEVYKYY